MITIFLILQNNIFTSEGEKWHTRRKILTPAFHFNILQKYLEILIDHGVKIADSLNKNENKNKVDLISFLTYHTLSAICG